MRISGESTAHHRETIADLRAKLAEADQQAAKLRRMIEGLLELYGDQIAEAEKATPEVQKLSLKPLFSVQSKTDIRQMGLGDACLRAIEFLGGRATNHEIVAKLKELGYENKSSDPLNNVGTGLNHRAKARGDVMRDGRFWVLRQQEISELNGHPAP